MMRRRGGRHGPMAILGPLAALAGLWAVGLLVFTASLPDSDTPPPTGKTDAIVVLTGGSLRLDAGITLLAEGKAKKLFVSGVHQGVEVRELLQQSRRNPQGFDCCIVLGYSADDTRGNAEETAAWMRQESYRSLRLVTANYHMPRSLFEFQSAMPEVDILPHPVFPERVMADRWWQFPGTARLVVGEYHKLLAAVLRQAFHDLLDLLPEGVVGA